MTTERLLDGHPISLTVLDFGLFRVHANGRVIGICGFLIRTSAGETIVVDSGFPAKYATDVAAASAEDHLGAFGEVLSLGPENLVQGQLAKAGVTPEAVDLFILTHSHIDHVGGLDLFPDAPILMAAAERALPKPLYWGDVRPIEWPDRTYRLIDADTTIGPGFEVLFAPGHAPGQLSLLLTLPETGPVLLTSDAISRLAEIDEGFEGSWDVTAAQAQGARLMDIAARTNAFVIYGHCPSQWPTLRKAPEAYT